MTTITDTASGAKTSRQGLDQLMKLVRRGRVDVIVYYKLDRLGRSVKGLVDLVCALAEEGVQFQSLTDGIDTTTPQGRFFFHLMASLAQMERELIGERTKAGLEAARKRSIAAKGQSPATP